MGHVMENHEDDFANKMAAHNAGAGGAGSTAAAIPTSINGALSIGDANLGGYLDGQGTFVKSLIWNPLCYAVIYGNSLNAYNVIQGLLLRNVSTTKIILIRPPENQAGGSERELVF
jgi:hypothetical protein